jgi:hypothetical protein
MESTSKVVEQDLARFAIEAHGGLERWNRFSTISAHLIQGGVFWGAKGKAGVLGDVTVKVDLRNEKVSHWPFGSPDRRSRFEPQRVAVENANGEVLEELVQPRSSFKGHTFETPWNDLQLAYFVGCAMWTYLSTPFFLARPGIESEEIEPWQEDGNTWRRMRVRFPSGDIAAAHYVSDIKKFSGIVFPTKHRIFGLKPDGHAAPEPLVVSIDIDQLVLF